MAREFGILQDKDGANYLELCVDYIYRVMVSLRETSIICRVCKGYLDFDVIILGEIGDFKLSENLFCVDM